MLRIQEIYESLLELSLGRNPDLPPRQENDVSAPAALRNAILAGLPKADSVDSRVSQAFWGFPGRFGEDGR